MRNRRNGLIACLLALLLLCGCSGRLRKEDCANPIEFYYCSDEISFDSRTGMFTPELRDLGSRQITIPEILKLYFAGPETPALTSPFPAGTSCEQIALKGNVLTLRLNEAYGTLTGVRRTQADACLTLTLTQIHGVNAIRITTPSKTPGSTENRILRASDYLLADRTPE